MIDRVASNMLGQIPWPPTGNQAINIGIALAEVGAAMYLWDRARRGGLSLTPWQLRTAAVLSGAAALWAMWHVKSSTPLPNQQVPVAGYASPGRMQ